MSFELSNSTLKLKCVRVSIASCDATFMQDRIRHVIFDVILVRRCLYYLEEKLNTLEHLPFKLGFGFTNTHIMIVYRNVLKSAMNYRKNRVKIIDL